MELKFRFLTQNDLPAIKKLSDSMDMRNDPKIGDTAKGLIADPKCDLYGAFIKEILVGVGGLRTLAEDYVWIEDVRIHGKYQKLGIGTKIFSYGEKLARERNCRFVAFQTVTENTGSCRIGEKLGFERCHEMTSFYIHQKKKFFLHKNKKFISIKRGKKPAPLKNGPKLVPINSQKAFALLNKIPNAPSEEICIGWAYRPLVETIFDDDPDMNFYAYEDTLLLEGIERNSSTGEIQYVKAIVYGNEKNVPQALNEFRMKHKEIDQVLCLVPETLVPTVEKTDFKFCFVWTGNRNIVVLFKKRL